MASWRSRATSTESALPRLPLELGALAEERLHALAALGGQLDGADAGQIVLTTVTWTEAYVDALLRALIAQSGYKDVPFAEAMFADLEDRIFQSWPERHAWLNRGFGISIAAEKAYSDVATLIDLRNALVHGNGRLTERQCRDVNAMVGLEVRLRATYDVRVERRQLFLGPDTGGAAVLAVQAYILKLDAEARRLHPTAAL